MGTLWVVSTPIGNLEDVTRRAERVLAEADHLLAEDTRRTRVLLGHLGIRRKVQAYHAHNEAKQSARALEWLDRGESVALVSDAGTPLVSDPGDRLVRVASDAGHDVVPVPGASAVLAALAVAGLPATPFVFLGFLPRKGPDRRAALERIAGSQETVVFFESAERLDATLSDLEARMEPERELAVARELTKLHEEVVRGTLAEARRYYENTKVRGELTLVLAPRVPREEDEGEVEERVRQAARDLLEAGTSPSRAAREIADRLGVPRNRAYALVLEESR